MADRNSMPAKQPHLAWRITRVALHIIGKVLLWMLTILGTATLICAIAGLIFMTKFSDYLKADVIPAAEEYADNLGLDNISLSQTSIILAKDPETGEWFELQTIKAKENRIWVSYENIPADMINATIAIEDKRFTEHNGVDWLRTISAVGNFASGDASFGASTITQQLIKNLSKDDDVTINRKVNEIFRALAVEERYTKPEIMEWYLNTIYLGEGCYGVQSAAAMYFGKDVSELTAAECASIIAITNNPSLYDPYINPEGNRNRQLLILAQMYEQGYFATRTDYVKARLQEMDFHSSSSDDRKYSCTACGFVGTRKDYIEREGAYFCPSCDTQNYSIDTNNYYSYFEDTIYRDVVNDLCEQYGYSELAAQQKLLTGGYRIYATIDPSVQALVDSVYENLDNIPNTVSIQQLQSAIVVIDNSSGDIVAMSGGVGRKEGNLVLNRATQSSLPMGSSIKPIAVYAPALDAGLITPATVFEDSSFYDEHEEDWPQNYTRSYSGMCTVLKGVTSSLNTLSVKTLHELGVQESYDFLTQKLGLTTLVESVEIGGRHYSDINYAPLALGELTYGATVREVTQAYATFPNNGMFREARTYTLVEDPEGNIVLENAQESHTALGEKACFYMTSMLQSAVSYGTGYSASFYGMEIAGKTGTSNNDQTRWFAGYTPYYTAAVWCGYDQMEQIILSGSYTNPATVMWKKVMQPLHDDLPYASFPVPNSVRSYEVCSDCGLLATEACEKDVRDGVNRVTRVYLYSEDAPKDDCTCHVMVKICGESGKIANEYCEHVEGNKIEETGMLIFNEDWKVGKDEPWVYNEEDKDAFCTIHTKDNLKPTEPEDSSDATGPDHSSGNTEPTEPTEPNNPDTDPGPLGADAGMDALPPEASWYERRDILLPETDR